MIKLAEKIVFSVFVFVFGSGFLFSKEQNALNKASLNVPAVKQDMVLASLSHKRAVRSFDNRNKHTKLIPEPDTAKKVPDVSRESKETQEETRENRYELTLAVAKPKTVQKTQLTGDKSSKNRQELTLAVKKPHEKPKIPPKVQPAKKKEGGKHLHLKPEKPKTAKKARVAVKKSKKKRRELALLVKKTKKTTRVIITKTQGRKNKTSVKPPSWRPKNFRIARVYNKVYKSGKISRSAVTRAFKYYVKNVRRKKLSKRYLAVADYTKTAKHKRLHIISLSTGKVYSYMVAHGKNSGPTGGRVHRTSNRRNSYKTSTGFFKIGYKEGVTKEKRHRYLPVTGLQRSNRRAGLPNRLGGRDIVLHTASYVNNGGRSHGCFAIRPNDRKAVFSKLKGALFYSYAG